MSKKPTRPSVVRGMKSLTQHGKLTAPGVYELEVFLIGGPISKRFAGKNRVVSRTILILGNQTLNHLHDTIFAAFGRREQHWYEFQVGGKGPMDPKARRYVLLGAARGLARKSKPAGVVTQATIDSLGLKAGDTFGYWFDFGDDWWHQINVEAIRDGALSGGRARITKRVGASPPQYVDLDQEDGEEDD